MRHKLHDLGHGTADDIAQALTNIPTNTTTLDLGINHLNLKSGAELARAFPTIPVGVTTLDLSLNGFGDIAGADLALALHAIPASIQTLNLSGNSLNLKSGAELALALAAIPSSVTTLDLSLNSFGDKTGAELARALAALPQGINTLILSGNSLCNKTGEELKLIFPAIPVGVTTLNLSRNRLNKLNLETLTQAQKTLLNVKTIYLSYLDVFMMDDSQRQALKKIVPHLTNTLFLDQNHQILGAPGIELAVITSNNPFEQANLARRLHFPTSSKIPSLQAFASFFIKKEKIDITHLPEIVHYVVKTT